uniref:EOG090X0EEC n=1 Tax=Eubosmina coregoni TaxID=186181 RepID=A0A4Y7LPK9_9CRUS|nr:EOG090X0EEC [Eubosmina coregoni]SVE70084.1 EOG090X0EEC [Eubosmina coregoni]
MPGSVSSNSSYSDCPDSRIVQVTNVAPQATKEQMQTLFGFIGKVEDLRLYPTIRDGAAQVAVRICFVKFLDANDVNVALHMSNTVFIDRALIVTPYSGNELPDEYKALEILNTVNGHGVMEPKLPPTLTNQIEGVPPHQVIRTLDPRLSIHNLPTYPLLPASTDSRRLEEIRRTVVAINLDPTLSAKKVIQFFASAGEVKYFRFCSKENDDIRYAMIEFVEQESVVPALKLNNKQLGDNTIKVHHSTYAINKPIPQNKSNEAAQKEIEEAVNRVKEAQQSLLTAVITPEEAVAEKEKVQEKVIKEDIVLRPTVEKKEEKEKEKETVKRSRTHSRSRSRSRRRSSSRSRRRRTSRSRSRKRSRSRSRKRTRSRSRSRDRRKRSRSRSRDRRKRSRSRERRRRTRSRSRSRKKSPSRPSRDRRSERADRDRSKERTKEKDREKTERVKDKKEKGREGKKDHRDKDKDRERKEKKKEKRDKKDRPKSPPSKGESSDEKFDSHDLEILRAIR